MVYIQLNQYFANEDVSSLLYRKFRSHNEDVYPTFSVCIVSYDGRLFEKKFGKNRSSSYAKYLLGQNKENVTTFANIDFDDVVIDVKALFEKYHRKTKEDDGKYITEHFDEFEEVFDVIHQNPDEICFTKKDRKDQDRLFKYDLVRIDAKWLLWSEWMECHVYIHQKGQFIRTLTKPTINLFGKSLRKGKLKGSKGFKYIIRMRSNALEVLRKREDAVEACNDSLIDDDQQWRESVVEKIQCVPPYMERFFPEASDVSQKCNPDQLLIADDVYSPYDDFEAGAKEYLPPCTQMGSVVTTTENVERLEDENITSLVLKFEYPTDYRETINKRGFVGYDLWSQIGGITGIIVGYSLMQIPETFESIFIWIKNIIKPSKK